MPNWDRIVQEYGPTVWRTAYRLLGRVDDAQDCFQDTFLSALKVCRRERVRNWAGLLSHLATVRALDRLRKRISQQQHSDPEANAESAAAMEHNPAGRMEAQELGDRLRSSMAKLPLRQAEVFALHFLEHMSHRQISATLGLTRNAVAVLLRQARQRLRVLLDHKEERGQKR